MSGTSLDGVDLALCHFHFDGKWTFRLISAETVPYSKDQIDFLISMYSKTGSELIEGHLLYGKLLGNMAAAFLKSKGLQADYISSHGHTIYHQPAAGYTFQLGDGKALAQACGLPVVCDFRSRDVGLGGQGAPLVPIGDRLLFSEYDYCLNLGGIANISYELNGERIAFDVCPCNLALNHIAEKTGLPFDKGGRLASAGKVDQGLLNRLSGWEYYTRPFPKSMGREDIEKNMVSLIDDSGLSIEDLSATMCRHIALQIAAVVNGEKKKLLVTGGGAFHSHLMREISLHVEGEVVLPSSDLINFKEAIIFAFLGALHLAGQINTLSSVTGARNDSIGGELVSNYE